MGAGFHGGFGATKGSRSSNEAYPGTVKLVKNWPRRGVWSICNESSA
jgi:hypothetical protein